MKRLLLLALPLLIVAPPRPCPALQPAADDTLAFSGIDERRYYIYVQEPGTRVFRDATAWGEFWEAHTFPWYATPKIAFEDTMVIVISWGCCRNGCDHAVEAVRSVVFTGTSVVVDDGYPNPGACLAWVAPTQIIKVRRIEVPVIVTGRAPTAIVPETWGSLKSLYKP